MLQVEQSKVYPDSLNVKLCVGEPTGHDSRESAQTEREVPKWDGVLHRGRYNTKQEYVCRLFCAL